MTLYARTNTSQLAIPGKYGRVLVSDSTGALYPVNFKKWSYPFQGDDIPNPGFEDSGFKNGLIGLVGAEIKFEGPYQLQRTAVNAATGTLVAAGMALLVPTTLLVYECWLVHPDSAATWGSLMKYTGVGQVQEGGADNDATDKANSSVSIITRGPIYAPGNPSVPTPATMLANFINQLT